MLFPFYSAFWINLNLLPYFFTGVKWWHVPKKLNIYYSTLPEKANLGDFLLKGAALTQGTSCALWRAVHWDSGWRLCTQWGFHGCIHGDSHRLPWAHTRISCNTKIILSESKEKYKKIIKINQPQREEKLPTKLKIFQQSKKKNPLLIGENNTLKTERK